MIALGTIGRLRGHRATPGGYLNVGGVPTGTYYVRGVRDQRLRDQRTLERDRRQRAEQRAGVRTPNAPSGRLPWFDVRDLVVQIGERGRGAGYLSGMPGVSNDSCQARPGLPFTTDPSNPVLELQKTQRNRYIDYMVSQLAALRPAVRLQRQAYASELRIIAGDEIAYPLGQRPPRARRTST